MSRYRYCPVTVLGPTLPTVTVFGPTLPNFIQRDINVTDRYRPLPNFTINFVTSVTDRNIVCFEHIFKVLFKKLM
jgi:hypothetical protein